MKVILTVDIKGKGKAREIHDFPSGYAYFLIKNHYLLYYGKLAYKSHFFR